MGPNRYHSALLSILLRIWSRAQESDHGGLHSIDLAAVRATEKKADVAGRDSQGGEGADRCQNHRMMYTREGHMGRDWG